MSRSSGKIIKDGNFSSTTSDVLCKIPVINIASVSPTKGAIAYNLGDGFLYYGNGIEWIIIAGGSNFVSSITGNTGAPLTGAVDIVTANTNIKFAGASPAETLDFGATTNLVLGDNLASLIVGTNNVGLGLNTLNSLTNGNANTAIGVSALSSITGSTGATAVGYQALVSTVTPGDAFGYQALASNTSGTGNTAMGFRALTTNLVGNQNVGIGTTALASNFSGSNNTAVGYQALLTSSIVSSSTAVGSNALLLNVGGTSTAVGASALVSSATGNQNTAIGAGSGGVITAGSVNTFVGYNATADVIGRSNSLVLGANGVTVAAAGNPGDNNNNQFVLGSATTPLWTITSTPTLVAGAAQALPGVPALYLQIVLNGTIYYCPLWT